MSDLLQPLFIKHLHIWSGWELPESPTDFGQGNTAQNLQHAMNLFAQREIEAAPLRSHVLCPRDAGIAVMRLLKKKEIYHSVVFDWASINRHQV